MTDAITEEVKEMSLDGPIFKDVDAGKTTGQDEYITHDDDACIGKQCPDISGIEFLNGDKHAAPKEGQVVVVVLWGQYHKPGYKFLPFYTQVQKKYGDKVCVVGISVDPDTSYAKKFLEDPNKKYSTVFTTEFSVAWGDHKIKKAFMEVNDQNSFSPPHAFVVDSKGVIVWHQDHSELGATAPSYMGLMEQQLDNLVAGKELIKVGNKPEVEVAEGDEEEGETADVGDVDDLFF